MPGTDTPKALSQALQLKFNKFVVIFFNLPLDKSHYISGLKIPLYGKTGIIIAESIYCFPVATTILMVAFSAADNRLYEAADTMRTSALRKMITITIPNVKYGLINAIFVVVRQIK